jgi:hypothetical protein
MSTIILSPEIYPLWLYENTCLLLCDNIILDKNDFEQQRRNCSRSTFDYKANKYLQLLYDDLNILKLIDYSSIISIEERNRIHDMSSHFTVDDRNLADITLIGKQAWYNYSEYLYNKIKYYDDPREPAIASIVNKLHETTGWRDRLFQNGVLKQINSFEIEALRNAVTRTLSKAIASVKIYQKISNKYPSIQLYLHDRMEYEHAFSVASRLELNRDSFRKHEFKQLSPSIITELIYECYRVYCINFGIPLIEQPDLLYNLRKDFTIYREILNDIYVLFSKFSFDTSLTKEYINHQIQRIFSSLKNELILLTKRFNKSWDTVASISLIDLPVGQLIRLLMEDKCSEIAVQEIINSYFDNYSNKNWKNLFVFLKSSEKYRPLFNEKDIHHIDEKYFQMRPNWWIDYLPWYEGGPIIKI